MLFLFLLVAGISFVGSLHPGTVNLAVIQTTLGHNRRAGLWLALGGSLPELGYSVLATSGLMLLSPMSPIGTVLLFAPVPVLLVAGVVAFRQKPVQVSVSAGGAIGVDPGRSPFWKGLALAGTNPQLLPYWSAVWLYLNQTMLVPVSAPASQWVFALGTSAGAFVLLLGLVGLADWQRHRIGRYLSGRWLNYVTGGLFIGMALWQVGRILTMP